MVKLTHYSMLPDLHHLSQAEDAPEDMVEAHDSPITRDAHIWPLTQQPYGYPTESSHSLEFSKGGFLSKYKMK